MIRLKKIKPVFTSILVTAEKYVEDVKEHNVTVITKGTLKEYQRIVAVGNTVRAAKEGDVIKVNPRRYAKRKVEGDTIRNDLDLNPIIGFDFPLITIDGIDYLYLDERDIEFIVEDYAEEKSADLIVPDTGIIV